MRRDISQNGLFPRQPLDLPFAQANQHRHTGDAKNQGDQDAFPHVTLSKGKCGERKPPASSSWFKYPRLERQLY
jgi:hypothetical protein